MRTLIVHNPKSGFGSDSVFEFQRALLTGGDECVVRALANKQPVEEAVTDAEDFDVVVISGGDGTIAAGLYALANRDVAACVYPSGTANLLFFSLGNAQEPAVIAAACRNGVSATCDLGEISWTDTDGVSHKKGFALMAGTGFDAQLMSAAAPAKNVLGQAAYFMAVAGVHPELTTYTIESEQGVEVREGITCIIANNAKLQGEIEIIPNCRMDDGMLDTLVLEVPNKPSLLPTIVAAAIDRNAERGARPSIESFRGAWFKVTADRPLPLQIDGDPLSTTTSYEARVLKGAVKLIVDPTSDYYPAGGAS